MHLLNTLYVTTPESRLRLDNDTPLSCASHAAGA